MRSDKKASDKRAYVSPYNHNVFKIPADPRAIQEAHEHDERRTSVPRQVMAEQYSVASSSASLSNPNAAE